MGLMTRYSKLLCFISISISMLSGVSLASSVSTTPKHFEYSWDGFVNAQYYGSKSWYRRQYYTPTSNTGACGGAESSQWFATLETSPGYSNSAGDTAYLESGNTTGVGALSFYYHMFGRDIGTLSVEVNDGGTWQRVWEKTGQQHTSCNDEWTKATILLSSFSSSKRFRFVGKAKGGELGDIGIDQIYFQAAPVGSVTYQYDALGRLVCVKDSLSGDRSFEYDDAGNRSKVSLASCN